MSNKSILMSLGDPHILGEAFVESFRKLAPQQQWKNPVMFVVYIGSMLLLFIVLWTGKGKK